MATARLNDLVRLAARLTLAGRVDGIGLVLKPAQSTRLDLPSRAKFSRLKSRLEIF